MGDRRSALYETTRLTNPLANVLDCEPTTGSKYDFVFHAARAVHDEGRISQVGSIGSSVVKYVSIGDAIHTNQGFHPEDDDYVVVENVSDMYEREDQTQFGGRFAIVTDRPDEVGQYLAANGISHTIHHSVEMGNGYARGIVVGKFHIRDGWRTGLHLGALTDGLYAGGVNLVDPCIHSLNHYRYRGDNELERRMEQEVQEPAQLAEPEQLSA